MTVKQLDTPFQKAFNFLKRTGKIETQQDVIDLTGVNKGALSQYVNGQLKLSKPFETKFQETFGIKLADFERDTLSEKDTMLNEMGEAGGEYLAKRRKLKHTPTNNGMPVFESAPATLSNVQSYRDDNNDTPDFWLSIPQYRHCNYACRAKGDSMHPVVRNHALVGGREITELSVIIFGDIYIVHTKNGIETIKYIHPDPDNENKILLVPYNGNAKTTPIHKSEILRLYVAEFVINPL